MTTNFANVQINDALLKMGLYYNILLSKPMNDRSEKVVMLATQTFLKFMESQEFAKECYEKVKHLIQTKSNYYLLLLLDQMLKNNKIVFRQVKRELQTLFKGVWEKVYIQYDNATKLQTLKLMIKVWGYIYGDKYQENLRKWLQINYKMKLIVSPQNEAELKEQYGTIQQPKTDLKFEQLISNMEVQQKPKRMSSKDESLMIALGIMDQE